MLILRRTAILVVLAFTTLVLLATAAYAQTGDETGGSGIDFAKAGVLTLVVYGLVELAKSVVPAVKSSERWTSLSVLVASAIAVFAVSESVWAHEQVIGGHSLDNTNIATKLVIVVLLAASAPLVHRVLGAVSNIGENTRIAPTVNTGGPTDAK